jgi:hypothetical protein
LKGQRKSTIRGGGGTNTFGIAGFWAETWTRGVLNTKQSANHSTMTWNIFYNRHKSKREIPGFHKIQFVLITYNLYIKNTWKQNSESDSPIFYCLEVLIYCVWYWLSCIVFLLFNCRLTVKILRSSHMKLDNSDIF